jgi:adenylate cyclase
MIGVNKIDYPASTRRFSARFPIISYLSTQMIFWIIAGIFLAGILNLHSRAISKTFILPNLNRIGPLLLVAVILGSLQGIILGLAEFYLNKRLLRRQSFGKTILLRTLTSFSLILLLFAFLRFVLFDRFIAMKNSNAIITLTKESWKELFWLLILYYFVMTLLINFIIQVNQKYGPGVLLPMLLGKYSKPQEEERIFMFMDLKSSTETAEKLGHLQYSSFVMDSIMDINQELSSFHARVYQYVGDEVVLTWKVQDGLKDFSCIRFFYACEKHFHSRATHYNSKYGIIPCFKAGLHIGKISAVEIGQIKKDIAYHGDTINTTARIQEVCNHYNKRLLVSADLFAKIGSHDNCKVEVLGTILLKGKAHGVGLVSVEWNDNN